MLKVISAVGAAFYVYSASLAFACQNMNVILDENFKTPDSGWGDPNDQISYGPSGASIKSEPKRSSYNLNTNYTSDGTNICAIMEWPKELDSVTDSKASIYGGIIFWAKDISNFYLASVTAAGSVQVSRKVANAWSVVTVKQGDNLKLARLSASDKNEIEVQITGIHAAVRLNGKPVMDFNGQPPSGGGYVGIDAGMGDPPLPIVFSRFQIATLP